MRPGWQSVSLGEILVPVSRQTAVASGTAVRTLGIRWYGAGCFAKDNAEVKAKHLKVVAADDVVYSKLFAWKGSFGVVPPELGGVLASTEFPTFRADEAMLLPSHFAVWSSRPEVWAQAEDASTGTTGNSRNRFSAEDFLDLTLELPPIEEQRRIVHAVRVIDRAVAAASAEGNCAIRAIKAYAIQLFEGLDAPAEELSHLTTVTSGGTPSRDTPAYYGGDIPWVKTGEVKFNRILDTKEKLTDAGVAGSSAKLFPRDTVVVAMYGQGATRGRCALLNRAMATNQACAGIFPTRHLEPMYLFHWLWSQYELLREQALGSSQDNLKLSDIAALEIPVPPLDVQRDIAHRLQMLRVSGDFAMHRAATLRQLRGSVVEALVTGQRPVPQLERCGATCEAKGVSSPGAFA